ncbi:LiPocalin-Related protein [Caenorhabditis elegans]|uniref:LiPocalin-Related protein n=1 Tax=Caenorhabditis elegans TaxID=6239 RepID=G5EEB8_CAEEL|nr:LiPocalin-Related protein [Caenorhabditis elegans]CAA98143.1 LiPocalin-Related protein [Caenorhabditis elegans]|eukprot:NP_502231.1 LiPocalin-Related protein [Caenorhabditis elegans]
MSFFTHFFSLIILIIVSIEFVSPFCYPKIPLLDLQPTQYNGSWFVIARKPSASRYFLPKNINSSMISLILQKDNKTLSFAEYHTVDQKCHSLKGSMTQHKGGYMMEVNQTVGSNYVEKIFFRSIYHGYSGEQNEEMNMVLYGCLDGNDNGGCKIGDELVLIMSNSRHPQTLQLYKSAQVIEDEACIDILHFTALDTYTECGDEMVDEDQKLRHAKIDEDNEFVDVECRVENIRPANNNISLFFKEPRVLTVVAYIDASLSGEQIAHISCRYNTETTAECEWIRQDTCFKTNLTQTLGSNQIQISSSILKVNGSTVPIDWSGFVLWENGDEYISMHCGLVDDDGGCDSVRVYVWSDEDHMDQPTINEIYRELQKVCVDPTDLIFLNTFHECIIPSPTPNLLRCQSPNGWSPITLSMLQGVWYIAADLNADPKMFLQSTVINMKRIQNSSNLELIYYAQKESDGRCIGPGNGTVKLTDKGELHVHIEYTYSFVPGYKSSIKFKFQILYLDNQRAVLYWCFRRSSNGTCIQHDVTFMIRSRHFSHNDLSMILPYLDKVCIDKKDLRWFDLHSQCGTEISSSTILRRDLITLTHYHVLDILTNVQEPKCLYNEIRGVRADIHSLERAGTWFLMSRMDEMSMDTYAMVGRIFAVTNSTAVLRLFQSAALPGEPRECFTRVFTIRERENDQGSDYWYELHFESTTKNSTFMIFRFLFYNRHVGVVYSCLRNKPDGRCDEKAIYVISRHESIDHAELTVLEKVAKSVCVEPTLLYHVAAHDECIFEHNRLKPPACSSIDSSSSNAEWVELNLQQIEASYGRLLYQVVASSNGRTSNFALRFDGQHFQKITEQSSGCLSSPVSQIRFSLRNRNLIYLPADDGLVALIHPAGIHSDLLLREAQMSGVLPCLAPTAIPEKQNCSQLIAPVCKLPNETLSSTEQLNGDWYLYSSDPMFVLNWRCTFRDGDDYYSHTFECFSESWVGECERSTRGTINIHISNSTFYTVFEEEEAPIRTPEAEIFTSGRISVTDERLLMLKEDHLVGRAYSLWLRKTEGGMTEKVRQDAESFCVWPIESQIRHTAMLC